MKKLFVALSAFSLLFASCAKDYACTCTETITTTGGTDTEVTTGPTFENVTKRWMKNTAECVSSNYVDGNFTYTNKCEIEKK